MTILERIVEQTRTDIAARRKKTGISDFRSFEDYEKPRKSLYDALNTESGGIRIIAEVKRASPSKGIIRENFDHLAIAGSYAENGAAAISVLTDAPFFKGHLDYLREISRLVEIPVLRKDFIVDFYQIEEARAHGADAILLIATITSGSQLHELHHAAVESGLECLVECYSEEDLSRVNFNQVRIFGVNNRDLNTFHVDVHRGIELLQRAPEGIVRVSESGLRDSADLQLLAQNGIHSALIGETFMREPDPGQALRDLLADFSHLTQIADGITRESLPPK